MKQVLWHSRERVDLPDLSAVMGLVDSEFRRVLSQGIVGLDLNTILRGFEVEPESPVSSRVLVRMDRTSDGIPYQTESLAVGAENFGAVIDYGVLIGGRSSDGSLEGAAQMLLDFAAQPVGVYIVEMRYVTTTGTNENRANWNEGTNAEYVSADDTRILPAWEIRFSPTATGNEWIALAQVNWNGATIAAGDITDLRLFAFEHFAGLADTTDQNVSPFDFDRTAARGQFGVTVSSPIAAINALQRQILDLKGQDNLGSFNWYQRVFSGPGAGWLKHTKSLRTVDTVTYTVGDYGDYGDFNGTDGLNQCLSYIQANAAVIPRRIKVVLKNRNPSTTGTALRSFRMLAPVVIPDKDIELLHEMGHGRSNRTSEPLHDVRGQARVVCQLSANSAALTLTGRSTLRMENLTWEQPGSAISLITVSGPVRFYNVVLNGYPLGWDHPALTCHSDQTVIDQCHLAGCVNIGGGDFLAHFYGGVVRNTAFDRTVLRLRTSVLTGVLTTAEILQGVAQGLSFERCEFIGRTGFGVSNPIHPTGMIDARGASNIKWERCRFVHSSDEDGLRLGNLLSGVDAFTTNSIGIEVGALCEFGIFADNTHAFHAGVNGTTPSGNHIYCKHDALTDSLSQTSGVYVHDSLFNGALDTNGTSDGCAINLFSTRYTRIQNNRFANWHDPASGGNIMVLVWSEDISILPYDTDISNNFFGDWVDDMRDTSCVATQACVALRIRNNNFSRYPRPGYGAAFAPLTGVAITMIDTLEFWVEGNNIAGWVDAATPLDIGHGLNIAGIANRGHIKDNNFADCGGSNILGLAGATIANCEFHGNIFSPLLLSELYFTAAINLQAATTNHNSFCDNRWDYIGGSGGTNTKTAIHLGAGLSFTTIGNHFTRGTIAHATLGGVSAPSAPGYATAPSMNSVFSYT